MEPLQSPDVHINQQQAAPPEPALRGKDLVLPLGLIVLVLVADQVLKYFVKTKMFPGEEHSVIGNWFLIHFTENNGIAFGYEMLGGRLGKLALTLFRLLAAAGIMYILVRQVRKHARIGFIISIALVFAGAVGNIIDSVFYGVWFRNINLYRGGLLEGKVVDMLYFPLFSGHFPSWLPALGGQAFTFFNAIFNLADASISVGIFMILLFYRRELAK